MKLIYLYVKESPLGLKYLGITTSDPFKYKGSGLRWNNHLKAHKIKPNIIKTIILLKTDDKDIISFWGLYYSKLYNIVKADNWANLIPESGGNSTLGIKMSDETKKKLSDINKGKKLSDEHKRKLYLSHKGKKMSEVTKLKLREINLGRKHTKDTKIKMSNSSKGHRSNTLGYKFSDEFKRNCKERLQIPVIQYDLNMNFIKEWESANIVMKKLKIQGSSIGLCCKGKFKTAGGFKWKYKNK